MREQLLAAEQIQAIHWRDDSRAVALQSPSFMMRAPAPATRRTAPFLFEEPA